MPGQILIVDDLATNRIVMKVKLSSACYQVLQAANCTEAVEIAHHEKPDLILLGATTSAKTSIETCQQLKNDPATREIPVIVVSGTGNRNLKLQALRAGADDCLTRPFSDLTLLARIRSLLRSKKSADELQLCESTDQQLGFGEQKSAFLQMANITLISDHIAEAPTREKELSGLLECRITMASWENALAIAETGPASDIIVLEENKGRGDEELHLISELRSRMRTKHAAIIVILDKDGTRDDLARKTIAALDIGANDVLADGFDAEELALRMAAQLRRKKQADRLRESVRDGLRLAMIDPLTGLYNRRYAMMHLARIARADSKPYALMLLDLDRFKLVNDIYGHSAGDQVLREVGRRLRGQLRDTDFVARIGGEEFMVVMPDTSLSEATQAAERMRERINKTPISLAKEGQALSISLSIGVAMGGGEDAGNLTEEVLEQADRALYAAKSDGRNQVIVGKTAA